MQSSIHHPWDPGPSDPGNKWPEAHFLGREGPAAIAEGGLGMGHPQPQEVFVSLARRMSIRVNQNSSAHKKSATPRADN